MTPRKFDKYTWVAALGVAAAFLLIALAGQAQAREPVYATEERMELVLGATEIPVGTFIAPLCLGIGKVRGVKQRRYAKFVCSALVYPDTHIIIRARLNRSGRVVFG